MDDDPIKIDRVDEVIKIVLHRPDSFNAFGADMIQKLSNTLMEVSKDLEIKGVVITGAGKAFCTGGDLKWLVQSGKDFGKTFHTLAALYHQAILEIRHMPKPVVAAVNGLAAGGGFSLALACDFRVMESSAVLRQAYTSNGLSIDGGGTFTLPRLVGLARALEIAALDRPISATQALGWGLVNEMAEDGRSVERALALIKEILEIPLSSFTASKRLLLNAFETSLESQLEKERDYLSWCAEHPNGQEGIRAFLEKRKPVYI